MDNLKLSVIIPSYNSSNTIEKCLSSFLQPENSDLLEVIVIDSSSDNTAVVIKDKFPWVKLYSFSERMYAGVARNYGIAKSQGDIIAFIDSDCYVDSDAIRQIIDVHQKESSPLIGGVIDNGNPESFLGWVYYFASFIRWLPRKNNHPIINISDLATGCLTVKKWIFEKYGYFPTTQFCEDTEFCWQIKEKGYFPVLSTKIKVYHINPNSYYKLLKQKINHGKSFAYMRVNKDNFSRFKLIIYCLCSFFLPFLLLYRNIKSLIEANIYIKKYISCLPLIFIVLICWCYGEFLGYLKIMTKFEQKNFINN